jgi:hypothetical protein
MLFARELYGPNTSMRNKITSGEETFLVFRIVQVLEAPFKL